MKKTGTGKKPGTATLSADIIIVGGGIAGLTLTCLLAAGGIDVICIDRDAPADATRTGYDERTTAISFGSSRIMADAGVWDDFAARSCPIEKIDILDGGGAVLLNFAAGEVDAPAFGWIAENRLIRAALLARVASLTSARHLTPATVTDFAVDEHGCAVSLADGRVCRSRLVVGADGRASFTREWMGIGARQWSYRQRALVCAVSHEFSHNNIAVEDFRAAGPFAILPMTDDPATGLPRSSVVWTEHCREKDSALHAGEDVFNAALQARFPERYGAVRLRGGRAAYPLGLIHAHDYIAPRMALVADAAHGIHPIAGQGLNLGLRDLAALAALVRAVAENGGDPGDPALLGAYQRLRRRDNMAMAGATDTLNRLFSNDIAPLRAIRRRGLRLVGKIKPAKKFFMRQAMGTGRSAA